MEVSSGQTSFIPRRPLTARPVPRPASSNLFLVLAVIILVIALLAGGLAYGYRYLLDREINRECAETTNRNGEVVTSCGLRASLEREERALDRFTILELMRLDRKLKEGKVLLDGHRTLLPVFSLLEELTIPTLRYTQFSLNGNSLELSGQAGSYEDVAVQSLIFAAEKERIANFLFSDLNLNEFGNVVFGLQMNLTPGVTSYLANLPRQ